MQENFFRQSTVSTYRASQQEITLELSKVLFEFLFVSLLLFLRIIQCHKESLRNILQWCILVNGGTHHVLHFFDHAIQSFFTGLDHLARRSIHGWMSGRFAEDDICSLARIRQGSLLGPHSRSQNVIHRISQNGTSPIRIHALGSGQRQLQSAAVIGIDRKQGGCGFTSTFV